MGTPVNKYVVQRPTGYGDDTTEGMEEINPLAVAMGSVGTLFNTRPNKERILTCQASSLLSESQEGEVELSGSLAYTLQGDKTNLTPVASF